MLGGHRIQEAASKRFAHVGLELGGNDPAYVAEDCDLEKTVENIVDGACYNAGQSCCAVERVAGLPRGLPRGSSRWRSRSSARVLGDPVNTKTTLGPIAQPAHVAELEAFVRDAESKGARVVVGGKRASVGGKGRSSRRR